MCHTNTNVTKASYRGGHPTRPSPAGWDCRMGFRFPGAGGYLLNRHGVGGFAVYGEINSFIQTTRPAPCPASPRPPPFIFVGIGVGIGVGGFNVRHLETKVVIPTPTPTPTPTPKKEEESVAWETTCPALPHRLASPRLVLRLASLLDSFITK